MDKVTFAESRPVSRIGCYCGESCDVGAHGTLGTDGGDGICDRLCL